MGSGMVVGGVVVGGGVIFLGSRQIRLSGRHWACGLVLQLEKEHGDPWQKIWFWGLFHKTKGPRAKG